METAYAGAQTTASLIMTRPGLGGPGVNTQTINLKTAGGRSMSIGSTSTALSGDTLQAIVPAYYSELNLQTNNDLSDAPPNGYIVLEISR
ncbi:hypothetical protein ACRAWD_21965 [Caulobacter segnis]